MREHPEKRLSRAAKGRIFLVFGVDAPYIKR
jgi:hypothetical protein